MTDLSVIIPSRNEMFLARTIQDILEHIEGDTEIIAVLDGQWADPPIPDHPRVTLIYHSESIGQRAAMNEAAKLSTAKYIMKVDAHCAFDPGFDAKMMADMQDDWTMAPLMRNLHTFDWVCPDGHRRYQGPSGVCRECGKETTWDVVWIAKPSPRSTSYCFDSTPHFQYFGEFKKRPEGSIRTLGWDGRRLLVGGERRVVPLRRPASFNATCLAGGDVTAYLEAGRVPSGHEVEDPAGLASGVLTFPMALEAGATEAVVLDMPLSPGVGEIGVAAPDGGAALFERRLAAVPD